jgi:non-heme chloroperoxidase
MPFITTKDKTEIFYKDWGNPDGQVIFFSHGWPLHSDDWDHQMYFFAEKGYRAIAYDRRGHGRSSQPWEGNNLDQWTDDIEELFAHLDLKGITLVGHSTGGGEVTRYTGKHGLSRVAKVVLISASPPNMLHAEDNPSGLPIGLFDGFRANVLKDRAQFFLDVPTGPFFGFNREGVKPNQGLINNWFAAGMQSSVKASHDTVATWAVDLKEDLRKLDVPVLILHGDDDQIVPIDVGGRESIKYLPNGKLKEYPGACHALPNIYADKVNNDILEFLKS